MYIIYALAFDRGDAANHDDFKHFPHHTFLFFRKFANITHSTVFRCFWMYCETMNLFLLWSQNVWILNDFLWKDFLINTILETRKNNITETHLNIACCLHFESNQTQWNTNSSHILRKDIDHLWRNFYFSVNYPNAT